MQRQWFGKQDITTRAYAKYMPSFICLNPETLSEAGTVGNLGHYADLDLEPDMRRLRCSKP